MSAETPAPAARCRACAAEIAADALRCDRCGAPQRDDACPHCRAVTGASPHPELRFRCDVCGGPRIPAADPRIRRSGREIPALQKAHAAASSRTGWRAATVASGLLLGFDVLVLALLMLISGPGVGLLVAALLTMGPLAAFVLWALQRAKARGREIQPALDAAWLAAATDVARQTEGPLTAGKLASTLGIAEPQAEELLALLEVNDVVPGAMMGAGELAEDARLRIAPPAADAAASADADAGALASEAREAEEEALAAGEAAEAETLADADPAKLNQKTGP